MKGTISRFWWSVSPWLSGALVIVFGNCTANAAWDTMISLMQHRGGTFSWPGLISLAAFAASSFWFVRRLRRSFFPQTRRLTTENPAHTRKHLVVMLSKLRKNQEQTGLPTGLERLPGTIADNLLVLENNKQENRAKGNFETWPWEMTLRAMAHHLEKKGPLRDLTLICSKESITQLGLFHQHFSPATKDLPNFQYYVLLKEPEVANGVQLLSLDRDNCRLNSEKGWNYNDYDELSNALWGLMRELADRGIRESDIMIDFTGGKKVTGAVAAAMTFNRDIKAQYVDTETFEGLGYDLVYAVSDTGGYGKV